MTFHLAACFSIPLQLCDTRCWFRRALLALSLLAMAPAADAAFSLVLTNGYGDCYRMNMLRNRENYQAYRGICSYRGFSLSGCSTTGEVVMLRIKATPSFGEYFSIVSTSLRWGTTMYFLNDLFRPLCSWVSAGYENWYPFDMSCSVAMYINSGGYGVRQAVYNDMQEALLPASFALLSGEERAELVGPYAPKAYSLVLTNGYGDCYRMNMLRNRENYQAYRGICSYRGFSLSGCSTTGEVVMLRIKATPSFGEHFSLLSTSMRWGTTMYVLNDVFRPLCSWVMAGYENWYPFDMSCSVAMYINSGGYGLQGVLPPEPVKAVRSATPFAPVNGTNVIGALLPLTGDLAPMGAAYVAALNLALAAITNTPGMPPIRLQVEDTRTDAATAYVKLTEMRSNGVHIVLGPETSEECRILKIYANTQDMLLLSSSATAVPLAISGDSLMRLTIDDSHQARALAELIAGEGITEIAIMARSDMYGEGLMTALAEDFRALGGNVFATNYSPRAAEFFPEVVSNLAAQVVQRSAVCDPRKIGVVTILFDEGVEFMKQAAAHSALSAVRWFGTDGMAQNSSLLADATAAAFAEQTRYVCTAFGRFTNAQYAVVENQISEQLGTDQVPRYAMSSYDGLWLLARALQQTGGTQTMDTFLQTIRAIANNYTGCTGPIVFNAADDRSTGTYDLFRIVSQNGSYTWAGLVPSAPQALSASQGLYADRIRLSWNVAQGAAAYAVWGALSDQLAEAQLLTTVSTNTVDLTGVPLHTPCTFWVRAGNSNGWGAFSFRATGWAGQLAGPCILLNGSMAPVTAHPTDTVTVAVELAPGVHQGTEADWWVLASTPGGWFYRDAAGQWRLSAGEFTPAYQGPLMTVGPLEVLQINNLPAGAYTFFFGVDPRDGALDPSAVWYDSITLTIQ